MPLLNEILSSRIRAEVFRILFGISAPELYHREIVRGTGLSESAVRQELKKLNRLDLIKRRDDGNRAYYRANTEHPLYQDLHQIVIKTVGLVDILKRALSPSAIRFAFVFGSIAKGEEIGESDIDLMVIGDTTLRKVTTLLADLTQEMGRDINPHVMREKEYQKRFKAGDHFATHVLKGPKIFIVGNKDDLEAMGKQRLVKS